MYKEKIGGSKLKSNTDHLKKWSNRENPGPLVIEVGASHGCNHDCVHCGFQQYSKYKDVKHYLDLDVFKSFLEDFRSLGGIEVYFAGNGEPLLNPSISAFFKRGAELGLDMTISTNGVLFTEKMIAEILPYAKWIKFSVNAGDAETYAKVHRTKEDDFKILVRNLEMAVKYKKHHNLKVNLLIQSIIYNLNFKSAPALVEVHKKAGTDMLNFRNVVLKNKKTLVPSDEITETLKMLDKNEKVEVRWDTFKEKENELSWEKCYGINFRTNMDDRGNLFTCSRNLSKNSIYGNIYGKRFKDIWQSPHKKQIFADIEKGSDKNICKNVCPSSYDNIFIENFGGLHV